ncbi:hypothetical protein [Archaeoglobus profundus]|uniref:Uncharacterized protein n=1 Tax=Archaeoglobus profundus (strain DSM 5631 / JCM 9629 / NBRC 100127 / Av18) TaxID=572546 RepID=D2RHA1_ARCPA|nr:hypothetical protein [Archaeoglobus profundus]ADB57676.1 hypothetical protein Arcpr_0611 [Archaeoglobus profundus DSM 5631]
MGAIPLILEVDGEEIYVEANPNERLFEVGMRAVPPEKWRESIIATTSGLPVDPGKTVRDIVRETGETRFRVLSEGDQGIIPDFPNFLRNVKVNSPKWNERAREEIVRIKMLNNLIGRNNPGFAYVNPAFYTYEGLKTVKGCIRVGSYGSVELLVFLPPAYPLVHPEATLRGRFFDKYMASNIHKHVYPFYINGKKIIVVCGDKKYLQNWTGRLGIAHYISDVVFPWIRIGYEALGEKSTTLREMSDILRILRGE